MIRRRKRRLLILRGFVNIPACREGLHPLSKIWRSIMYRNLLTRLLTLSLVTSVSVLQATAPIAAAESTVVAAATPVSLNYNFTGSSKNRVLYPAFFGIKDD